jgi:flagellar biosynthesis protein FliQ
MSADFIHLAQQAILVTVLVSAPPILAALAVGLTLAVFQALTQIQEQTLVFVPKILAMFVALLLALPFMADSMHGHMMRISSRIIGG